MRSQRAVTDLRHWLSNKFFVVGENSPHPSMALIADIK